MKEIKDIISAYDAAVIQGKRSALATVVHVEGSSYRRPGARMLVTEDGMLTGAISGGCLEGDALRKALMAINEQRNKLVTYDTTDDDDAKFGVQLGCNGIVHILFEPIDTLKKDNALQLLKKATVDRQPAVLVTLFSMDARDVQPGTCYFLSDSGVAESGLKLLDAAIAASIVAESASALASQTSTIQQYHVNEINLTAFVEVLQPSIALVICGAGNDAIPLVAIANVLGWEVTILDGRPTHANVQRFPNVHAVLVARSERVLDHIQLDDRTAWVLMTHNYNYDLDVLQQLAGTSCSYIGILGPKKKLHRMFDDLAAKNIVISDQVKARIYSPVGLDIGAETAEEIALSIAAEIKAVIYGKTALALRDKQSAIHASAATGI
ncbi:XdhC family protein [Pedobacter duraquae]|uniref:Xanthine/CO dehydrogenase XdhC/CoxF family maturation factor n=1 Tax=Pedobacter duraquae TaxID=425511 RepID=A0A4R6IC97_9SPHI|nr:XdhC/CoxI family protein [Pedobacter duraquae]TDO19562.1 xanthine/CO dehydrogenase XdhC/CoxF family maturation factor [Pedobacter duraquae]